MCDQNHEGAKQLFLEALHMAQDENDEALDCFILNLIAANYFEGGDLPNASTLFNYLLERIFAHDVAPTTPAILEFSLKLASIYSYDPETAEDALDGIKFVICSLLNNLQGVVNNIEELDARDMSDKTKNELTLLCGCYHMFAEQLLSMNYDRVLMASSILHEAYRISSKIFDPCHDYSLMLLNDIAITITIVYSPKKGLKFIEKAVEGAIISHSSELASLYFNLGLINLKLMHLKKARGCCKYSMRLAKKNPEHYNSHAIVKLSRSYLEQIQRLLKSDG
jgi:tetratricopeptide repeat protein 19